MPTLIRSVVAMTLAFTFLATSALGAAKPKKPPVPGEESFRSAVGYHAAVMEHCKQINKLARGRGAFNADLAREHAGELARNLEAAAKHQTGFFAGLAGDSKTQSSAETATVGMKLDESRRLAAALATSLKTASPDRKAIAATVTDLYIAERELVTAQKSAGKTLGIALATAPHKASANPRPRPRKKVDADAETAKAASESR